MKNSIKIFLLSFIVFATALFAQQKFTINLNDRADDTFKVTLFPDGLTSENDIFQFASTAPGTYQIMDVGRFVKNFAAYSANGEEIPTENISTNQWKIENPEKVSKIEYSISETWDTPVKEHRVYAMCGTSIEDDHVYFNGQAVLGYFHGLQSVPLWIKFEYPEEWSLGTPLKLNDNGYYAAKTYDFAVDSPFLLGKLTEASTDIEGTEVRIYTYSKRDLIHSENLLTGIEDILYAASDFTNGLPVDDYTFLMYFGDSPAGAWEHSYSSNYVMMDQELNEKSIRGIRSTVAHEFFHVVTPLNIHSELVEVFNYEKPTFSQHLWLYEGVTEWASDLMQLRADIITLDEFIRDVKQKLITSDMMGSNVSLTELGVRAAELPSQYGDIYMKGSVVGTLLDILILDLSDGKRGLREVINELAAKYGPSKPFREDEFFAEFTAMTYPEVGEFFENYVISNEDLPLKDYFEKVGIKYTASGGFDSSKVSLGFGLGLKDNKIVITRVNEGARQGLMVDDVLASLDSVEISLQTAQAAFGKLREMKAGDSLPMELLRGDERIKLNYIFPARELKHLFEINENPSERQELLRQAWMTNL